MFIQLIKLQRRIVYEKESGFSVDFNDAGSSCCLWRKIWDTTDSATKCNIRKMGNKGRKDSSWFYERFELFSDGTSVTSAGYQEKWISENGRLKIGDDVWSYTLSDNKLTLTAKNGSVGIYERVQQ